MNFTPRNLRDVLGQFATGVAIATATPRAGAPCGITINSFASVSLEPPLVLFSVDASLHSFPAFEEAEGFAINILRRDQLGLSVRFARRGGDKWAGVAHRPGRHGGVILHRSLATLDCEAHAKYRAGDHLIMIGRVVGLFSEGGEGPLVFFAGSYREIGPALIPEPQQPHERRASVA